MSFLIQLKRNIYKAKDKFQSTFCKDKSMCDLRLIGWHKGSREGVCLAPAIPAIFDTVNTSPFTSPRFAAGDNSLKCTFWI